MGLYLTSFRVASGVLFSVLQAEAQQVVPVPLSQLEVTQGSIITLSSGLLKTTEPKLRAFEKPFSTKYARDAKLRFRYLGPSSHDEPLASGQFRRQIGVKLLAQDGCNVLYVMWRFEPVNMMVVSMKRNPDMDESAECGNNGYTNLAEVAVPVHKNPLDQNTHYIEAKLGVPNATSIPLQILLDNQIFWSGNVSRSFWNGVDGPAGLRSDNGSFLFEFATGDYRSLLTAPPSKPRNIVTYPGLTVYSR